MSGAIVVEGIERYVPEVLKMRERILVLRDLVLPKDAIERKSVMESSQCKPRNAVPRPTTRNERLP